MKHLITQITDKATLSEFAEAFAAASQTVRAIEENRKSITVPLNASLDAINDNAKKEKAPHEEVIAATKAALSDWRKRPEVQEHYAKVKMLERKFREAEKEGDSVALELVGGRIAELTNDIPRSLPVDGGAIRFRENLVIDGVDLSVLEPSLTVRVPDEKAIRERIELVGACEGVVFHYEYGAAFYVD